MTPCPQCGRDAPDEAFCTWCGAPRAGAAARPRNSDFAAHSGEHVSQPAVITTLLPHLPRHRVHEFRWALIGGLAVIVSLVGAGLVVASILASAVLVPALYLVYLYEAQVYRDEPAKVLGMTIVAGALVGIVVSIVAKALIHTPADLLNVPARFLVAATLVLPLVQEVLKPLPVLALWAMGGQSKFSETIDGLTFGIAAGIGFAAAETIVGLSNVIAQEPVRTTSANWLGPVLSVSVLVPLMQATCTGIISAVLWRPGHLKEPLYLLGIPLALVAHVGFRMVSQVLLDSGVSWYVVLFLQAAVVGGLLVYIRQIVQLSLLDEAKDFGFQIAVCPHCGQRTGAAGFCPLCGGAISAGPRSVALPVGVGAPGLNDGVLARAPDPTSSQRGAAGGPGPAGSAGSESTGSGSLDA